MTNTTGRNDLTPVIGRLYTEAADAYDWRDAYPVVELNPDRTVGRITAIVPASDVPSDLYGIAINSRGYVESADQAWACDAMAALDDVLAAGFDVE